MILPALSAASSEGRDPDGPPPGRPPRRRLVQVVTIVAALAVFGAVVVNAVPHNAASPPASNAEQTATASPADSGAPGSGAPPSAAPGGSVAPSDGLGSAGPIDMANASIAVVATGQPLSIMSSKGRASVLDQAAGDSYGFPAWSPDGSKLADVVTGPTDASLTVYSPSAGGASNVARKVVYRSSDSPPFYLYWAPDGRTVSFLASETDGISLRVAPADGSAPIDGSDPASVLRRGSPLYFQWLGSSRLLVHVGVGSGAFLGEIGRDGSPATPQLRQPGDFRTAVVSQDGRFTAYARGGTDRFGQVVITARDGSGERSWPVFSPAAIEFAPKGDVAATIGELNSEDPPLDFPLGPLRLLDGATGDTRTLLDGSVIAFFWAPDGRTIAALRLQTPAGTIASTDGIRLAAATPSPSLAASSTPTPAPSAAPQVEVHVVFVDVASGDIRSERSIHPGDRFLNEFLPYFDQYAFSHHLWAPDSSSILLPLIDSTGATRLVALRPDGGGEPLAIAGDMGFWSR